MALLPLPNEFEALLSDGSDLLAEEMRFELGWNSTSTTKILTYHNKKANFKNVFCLSSF